LYGEGGMGKSTLARRLKNIAQGDDFKNHFRVLWLDWEQRKTIDERLVARDVVTPEIVFEHIYALFRDADFGRQFDDYEKAKQTRNNIEAKVEQAASREAEKGNKGAALAKLGAKGITKLLQTGGGTGVPMPVPSEPTEQLFEVLIEGGAAGMAQAREAATTLLRTNLKPDEYNIFILPHEHLARKLADGIRAAAKHKPIVLILDTYEIADRADFWLRIVMRHAGSRVLWVLAGRDDLAPTRRYGAEHFPGYDSDDTLSRRLRKLEMSEFSQGDVAAYFAARVPARPLPEGGAQVMHRATLGIPLAVGEAAAIWETGAELKDIVNDVPPRAKIVLTMTERFLKHCFGDKNNPQDLTRLHALALARRPNARLLSAMLQTTDLEGDLVGLKRRHSFVFVDEIKLHNAVAAFLREYLHDDLQRQKPEVRVLHERAVTQAREIVALREATRAILEERVEDERWQEAMLDLTHHSFWLDEDDGWAVLLPAFVGALAYDRDFARALLKIPEPLESTLTKKSKRQLKQLPHALSAKSAAEMDDALNLLEKAFRHWPDDGCRTERRAILDLQRARLLHYQKKQHEALALCEEAEKNLPEEGEVLRQQLGGVLNAICESLLWPGGRTDAVPSPEAERILPKVVALLPENQRAWYKLGTAQALVGRPEEAIISCQKAIELDPKSAPPHNGLGNVYNDLGQHQEALTAYNKAIELDPKYALPHHELGNVYSDLGQHQEALTAYKKAIELDPKNALFLSSYAIFLCLDLHDFSQAESYFRRAMEAAPDAPQYVINYAALSLSQGQKDEGRVLLTKAATMSNLTEVQQVGIAFHHCIHFADAEPAPLGHLKALLTQGLRATNWTFVLNIERARQDGHPNVALLEALQSVITDESDLASLNAFPEWQAA
jgi:tetratricopeptide (TPR) repeat protein